MARSATSTLSFDKNTTVGNHPLMNRFLRGVFNLNPSLPIKVTWDLECILSFLKQWSPAKMLDLIQLTMNVILLILLVTGQRGPSVHLIDLGNITWENKRIACRFEDLLKTSSPKHHFQEIVLKSFIDERICAVHHLKIYKQHTAALLGQVTGLFILLKTSP